MSSTTWLQPGTGHHFLCLPLNGSLHSRETDIRAIAVGGLVGALITDVFDNRKGTYLHGLGIRSKLMPLGPASADEHRSIGLQKDRRGHQVSVMFSFFKG